MENLKDDTLCDSYSSFLSDKGSESHKSTLLITGEFTDLELIHESRVGFMRIFRGVKLGKWFIIKTLKEGLAGTPELDALLFKEFSIGYHLNHPNIAGTISIEDIAGLGPSIIIEEIDGVTLRDAINSGELTAEKIREVGAGISSALAYLHSQQVVHRDLKPENVMLTRIGMVPKLIDFGFSDASNFAVLKQMAGTRHYMSPEQECGDIDIDGRSDIYSLGLMLREMNESLAKPDKRLAKIADKCCAENPDDRYPTAESIPWMHKRHTLIPYLVSLMVLAIAAVIVALTSVRREPAPQAAAPQVVAVQQGDSVVTLPAAVAMPTTSVDAPVVKTPAIDEDTEFANYFTPKIQAKVRETIEEYIHTIETLEPSETSTQKMQQGASDINPKIREHTEKLIRAKYQPDDPSYQRIRNIAYSIQLNELSNIWPEYTDRLAKASQEFNERYTAYLRSRNP